MHWDHTCIGLQRSGWVEQVGQVESRLVVRVLSRLVVKVGKVQSRLVVQVGKVQS